MITTLTQVFIPSEIFYFNFIFIILLFVPYIKMYCVKCRRVTETENMSIAMSKNGRLMRRGQCITCGELRVNLLKRSCWWNFS